MKIGLMDPQGFLSGWMDWFAHAVACSLYALGFGAYFSLVLPLLGWTDPVLPLKPIERMLYLEGIERARPLARLVRWAILIAIVALALVELNVAVPIVTGAFLIAFGVPGNAAPRMPSRLRSVAERLVRDAPQEASPRRCR